MVNSYKNDEVGNESIFVHVSQKNEFRTQKRSE